MSDSQPLIPGHSQDQEHALSLSPELADIVLHCRKLLLALSEFRDRSTDANLIKSCNALMVEIYCLIGGLHMPVHHHDFVTPTTPQFKQHFGELQAKVFSLTLKRVTPEYLARRALADALSDLPGCPSADEIPVAKGARRGRGRGDPKPAPKRR